ncbi:TetR/AcrR family transcriptional regulator [Microbacterium sp. ZW T5_45]|uniref:TetR/AcrR family transcriptional regulator n=1 Tax=Microbacterium sp. ZW T5_45 TaxID=3378080 RepID=UPI003853A983
MTRDRTLPARAAESGGLRGTTHRRAQTRRRLLDAARVVFAELGFAAATVELICDRAGFSRGAFYSNFSSKEDLFVELALRVSEEKLKSVETRLEGLKSRGLQFLTGDDIVVQLLDVLVEDRVGVLLMNEFRTNAMRNPEIATAYLRWSERMLASASAIVEDILRATPLRARVPPSEISRHVIMTWDSVSSQAVIAGVGASAMRALVSERVLIVARALVDDLAEIPDSGPPPVTP